MSRSRKSARAATERSDESQGVPGGSAVDAIAPESADEPEGVGPSKSEAARQAMKAGYQKPAQAVVWMKETFGIDMNPQHFSAIKSNDKKKEAGTAAKADPARRVSRSAAIIEGYVAPPERPRNAGEPDMLLALEGVKELVNQFGAERVKRMVDLLG
jgi:hypothetical protein